MSEISTKPYLLRAIYEWCTDNGYTPYIAVWVDEQTRVPHEYVKDGEIVLNVSPTATGGLTMANDYIQFNARFSGVSRDIVVPINNVLAIYARENGQGMAFDVSRVSAGESKESSEEPTSSTGGPNLSAVPSFPSAGKQDATTENDENNDPDPPKKGGRPTLTRIK
jgi:stringent starvation protein B